jgi:divalent metal cation (Fe/Co/Zn/Cd) transporter
MREKIEKLVRQDPDLRDVNSLMTMHLGPYEVLLALDVKFRENLSAEDAARAVDRIEESIRKQIPEVKKIYVEAQTQNTPIQNVSA